MCLTVFEASAVVNNKSKKHKREKAAKKYFISEKVLKELGTLCSERGGPEEARKSGEFVPLSAHEKEWVAQVIKASIRRIGEYAKNPNAALPQLTMGDFPQI